MLISHAAMSAVSIGLPRLGPSAKAALAVKSASQTVEITMLRVDMLDLPRAVDRPARDGVAVLVQNRRDRRDRLQFAALGDKFGAGGLHVAGLVRCAALQNHCAAVPTPRHAETGEGLAQYRLLQRRLRPGTPAIGRNHDLGDPARAGIADPGYFVEPRPLQRQPGRGLGDERFDFLQ